MTKTSTLFLNSHCNLTLPSVPNLPFSLLTLSELLVHKALIHTGLLSLQKPFCLSTHLPKKICPTYNSNAVNEIIGLKYCTLMVYIIKTFAGTVAFRNIILDVICEVHCYLE